MTKAIADKPRCSGQVHRSGYWRPRPCQRSGSVIRDNRHYCGTHDPVRIKERNDVKEAEVCARWAEQRELNDRAMAVKAEKERRLALFDEMLETLKLASSIIGHPDDEVSKAIVDFIAKAENKDAS